MSIERKNRDLATGCVYLPVIGEKARCFSAVQNDANDPLRQILQRKRMSAFGGIVLQNSFLGCVQNFPGALARPSENYVGVT